MGAVASQLQTQPDPAQLASMLAAAAPPHLIVPQASPSAQQIAPQPSADTLRSPQTQPEPAQLASMLAAAAPPHLQVPQANASVQRAAPQLSTAAVQLPDIQVLAPAPYAQPPAPVAQPTAGARQQQHRSAVKSEARRITMEDSSGCTHWRTQCPDLPFHSTPHRFTCANCMCLVCKGPAEQCRSWGSGEKWHHHCNADNSTPQWQQHIATHGSGLPGAASRSEVAVSTASNRPCDSTVESSASPHGILNSEDTAAHASEQQSGSDSDSEQEDDVQPSTRSVNPAIRIRSGLRQHDDPQATAADLEGVLHGLEVQEQAGMAQVPQGAMQNAALHRFQRRSLAWMLKREEPTMGVRGGILADEPGLGKTVQMLALIVSSPYPDQEDAEEALRDAARQQNVMDTHVLGQRARAERFANMSTPVAPGRGCSDGSSGTPCDDSCGAGPSSGHISPASNSQGEQGKKPSKGKAAPVVVARCARGLKDSRCTCVICRRAIEQENKRQAAEAKVQHRSASKKRKADTAFAQGTGDWQSDVGPTPLPPQPTIRSPSGKIVRRTLVVCPSCVAMQWVAEARAKTPQLSVCLYHGSNRQRKFPPVILASYDIVVTTFGMVCQEHSCSPMGPLFRLRWFRVILDEAQAIRNHRVRTAKACCTLQAEARWCVSGTPIVNSATDAFSLFNFIRYRPFCDIQFFNSKITRRIKKGRHQTYGPTAATQQRGYQELQVAMGAVTMRRLKSTRFEGRCIVHLPKRIVNVVEAPFATREERQYYDAIEERTQVQFNRFVREGFESNYANILVLLTKLRLACIHPYLAQSKVTPAAAAAAAAAAATAQAADDETPGSAAAASLSEAEKAQLLARWDADGGDCCICMDAPGADSGVLTRCGHGPMCRECVQAHLQHQDNETAAGTCPLCRAPLTPQGLFPRSALLPPGFKEQETAAKRENAALEAELQRFLKESMGTDPDMPSSTKIDAILNTLEDIRSMDETEAATTGERRTTKTVVFSYSTKALDLLKAPLRMQGFKEVRIDGTMSLKRRAEVVQQFHYDPEVRVLLCSTKAGGVGLNLTCASRVILIDVWWNCAPEDQAIDRCHRLGQLRDVVVTKLITAHHRSGGETVEQRMLGIQEEKRKLAAAALGDGSTGVVRQRLSLQELRHLFGLGTAAPQFEAA